jgi:hypothetical protein
MSKYDGIEDHSIECIQEARQLYGKILGAWPFFDPRERVERLLTGAIDTHFHAAPDPSTVLRSGVEYALRATEAGMQAVCYKSSTSPTARAAAVIQEVVNEHAKSLGKSPCKVLGGVSLCYQVGGLNADAVVNAAQLGGKFVWTPVRDASHYRMLLGTQATVGHGIDVIDDQDNVVPELKDVFKAVAEYDLVLVLAHQGTKERLIMVDAARELGVKRLLLAHVLQPITRLDVEQMKIFAAKGCYLENCFYNLTPVSWPWPETLEAIAKVGADRLIVASDLGNWRDPHPIDLYKITIGLLLEAGISDADVEKMVRGNAEKLIWGEP